VSLLFDPSAGSLLLGNAGEASIRQTPSAAGFLELAVGGQRHSSDPASAFFDKALAGATAGTLSSIRFQGGSGDTLTVNVPKRAGSLTVRADGLVRTEGLAIAGTLTIQAVGIDVTGSLRGSAVALVASGAVTIETSGQVAADRIDVSAGVFVDSGQLHADGPSGGAVAVSASNVLIGGRVSADGSGAGGTVRIAFRDSYVGTSAAVTSADGGSGPGGTVVLDGGAAGHLFSSGRHEATGADGGQVDLFARVIDLVGATVDASGGAGGGVRVGGDFHGGQAGPGQPDAETVSVAAATTIRADGRGRGAGGRVVVWSDRDTRFDGAVSATGGSAGGAGGFVEVSSKGGLAYGGRADTRAGAGRSGTLLLDPKNLVIDAVSGALPQFDFVDPHPTPGGLFGGSVTILSNGNVIVRSPGDNFGGSNAGAVYLYNGLTGALLSSLVGSNRNDFVGGDGIIPLN
jgi:hypothetical protein